MRFKQRLLQSQAEKDQEDSKQVSSMISDMTYKSGLDEAGATSRESQGGLISAPSISRQIDEKMKIY